MEGSDLKQLYLKYRHVLGWEKLLLMMFAMSIVFGFPISVGNAFQSPVLSISSIAWSPDGSMIAVGYATEFCQPDHPEFYDIQILDTQTGELIRTLAGSHCDITSIDWSPDGTKLAASSIGSYGTRVWDVQSGQLQMTALEGGQGTTEVKWRPPDGLQLADAAISNGIGILDPITGETIGLAHIGGTTLDWSPDGSKLVSGGIYDNQLYVADMIFDEQIMTLIGHTDVIATVDWSFDDAKIVSGSADDTVNVWDVSTGSLLFAIPVPDVVEVRWSPDGQQIATASLAGNAQLWDSSTGQLISTFNYPGQVYSVAWSPDGSQLVYGGSRTDGQNGTLEIVPVPTKACDTTIPAADTAALISAITSANGAGTPQTLCLTNSSYTLDTVPSITGDITILGNGATIAFASGGFTVAADGKLTLRDVEVRSG